MYMGNLKFDVQKERGGPMVLKPRVEVDLEDLLKNRVHSLAHFASFEPFFVISGATLAEWSLTDARYDVSNANWHFDEGNLLILSNEFENNERGETQWVPDKAVINAFFSQSSALRSFGSHLFSSREMSDAFMDLLDDCESGSRDIINRMLGVLYNPISKPQELVEVLRAFEMRLAPFILACDWAKHPKSTLFVNNAEGFHRGIYKGGEAARPLLRRVV